MSDLLRPIYRDAVEFRLALEELAPLDEVWAWTRLYAIASISLEMPIDIECPGLVVELAFLFEKLTGAKFGTFPHFVPGPAAFTSSKQEIQDVMKQLLREKLKWPEKKVAKRLPTMPVLGARL